MSTIQLTKNKKIKRLKRNKNDLYPVNRAAFLLRVGSPEHEDNAIQVLVQPGHHHICELLPALLLVGGGLVSSHREDSIEQEHA